MGYNTWRDAVRLLEASGIDHAVGMGVGGRW